MQQKKFNTVRGSRFIYSKNYYPLKDLFFKVAVTYGFIPLVVPNLHYQDLITVKNNFELDVPIYDFTDKSGRKICLKPEVTIPIVNEFLQIGQNRAMLSYCERCYRYDRPQKNRYREFTQLGVEYLTYSDEFQIIPTLIMSNEFISILNAKVKIEINYIDTFDTQYMNSLESYLNSNYRFFSRDVRKIIDRGEYIKACDKIESSDIKNLPKFIPELNSYNTMRYLRIKRALKLNGVNYVENSLIVRGLNYYNGLVFEYTVKSSNTSIGGGGEYGEKISTMFGKKINACGFAFGLDRIMSILPEINNSVCIPYKLIDITAPFSKNYINVIKNNIRNKSFFSKKMFEY